MDEKELYGTMGGNGDMYYIIKFSLKTQKGEL